jgi:hypothetical protein
MRVARELLHEKLACDSMAPHRARAFLRQLEPELGIQQMLDLKVVVSELAAMAIRFGSGKALVLEVRMDRDGNVAGEFGADTGWESVIAAARSDPGAGKLALRLLDRLCPDWGLDGGGGIQFWVERRRGAGLGTARD